jgi:RNA polymerase sigma factor (sigma-70 family)
MTTIDYLNRFMLDPLTKDEQITMLTEYLSCPCERKKLKLKNNILKHNLRLVIKEAKRICFDSNNMDDYISVCLVSFNRCIDKFNPSKGFAFSTFLTRCMTQDMRQYSCRSTLVKSPYDFEKKTSICNDSETVLKLMKVRTTERVNIKDFYHLLEDDRLVQILECFRDGKKGREISKELGITQQRVSQLKLKALTKIKDKVNKAY